MSNVDKWLMIRDKNNGDSDTTAIDMMSTLFNMAEKNNGLIQTNIYNLLKTAFGEYLSDDDIDRMIDTPIEIENTNNDLCIGCHVRTLNHETKNMNGIVVDIDTFDNYNSITVWFEETDEFIRCSNDELKLIDDKPNERPSTKFNIADNVAIINSPIGDNINGVIIDIRNKSYKYKYEENHIKYVVYIKNFITVLMDETNLKLL